MVSSRSQVLFNHLPVVAKTFKHRYFSIIKIWEISLVLKTPRRIHLEVSLICVSQRPPWNQLPPRTSFKRNRLLPVDLGFQQWNSQQKRFRNNRKMCKHKSRSSTKWALIKSPKFSKAISSLPIHLLSKILVPLLWLTLKTHPIIWIEKSNRSPAIFLLVKISILIQHIQSQVTFFIFQIIMLIIMIESAVLATPTMKNKGVEEQKIDG